MTIVPIASQNGTTNTSSSASVMTVIASARLSHSLACTRRMIGQVAITSVVAQIDRRQERPDDPQAGADQGRDEQDGECQPGEILAQRNSPPALAVPDRTRSGPGCQCPPDCGMGQERTMTGVRTPRIPAAACHTSAAYRPIAAVGARERAGGGDPTITTVRMSTWSGVKLAQRRDAQGLPGPPDIAPQHHRRLRLCDAGATISSARPSCQGRAREIGL